MPRVNTKSIKVSEVTKERLDTLRLKSETYDDAIKRLLDWFDKFQAIRDGTGYIKP